MLVSSVHNRPFLASRGFYQFLFQRGFSCFAYRTGKSCFFGLYQKVSTALGRPRFLERLCGHYLFLIAREEVFGAVGVYSPTSYSPNLHILCAYIPRELSIRAPFG